MNLSELKRRERELRKRLGDERYEQIYMRQQRNEQSSAKPVLPAYKQPEARTPSAGMPDRVLNNTQRTNSSAVPPRLTIADCRKGIEELDKRIESLNKQQYHVMLSGDDKKTADYDDIISNAEKQRDALKEEMARAMGIVSGSGRDIHRAGGSPAGGRPLFNADNIQRVTGLDDEEENPSKPSPSPVPPPMKFPKKENDFDGYINRNDYDNANDYLDAAAGRAYKYIKDGDKEGLGEFWTKNGFDTSPGLTVILNKRISELRKQDSRHPEINESDGLKMIVITNDGDFQEIGAVNKEEYYREKARSKAVEEKIIHNAASDDMVEDIDSFHYLYDNVIAQRISTSSDIPGQPKGENYGRMKDWYKADTEYVLVGWNDGDNKAEIYVYYGTIDETTGKETISRELLNSIAPGELWFIKDETDPEACFEHLLKDTVEMEFNLFGEGNLWSPRELR